MIARDATGTGILAADRPLRETQAHEPMAAAAPFPLSLAEINATRYPFLPQGAYAVRLSA